jgi:hypothetical protein
MRHYHVIAGLRGGYIPNSNELASTLKDAVASARWHVDQYRENGEKVRGGVYRQPASEGSTRAFWICRESESLPGTFWDYVEVTGPCQDDCQDEDDS